MKIVQLLQQYETLSSPFASLMLVCVRDYDVKTVVAQAIREICQVFHHPSDTHSIYNVSSV